MNRRPKPFQGIIVAAVLALGASIIISAASSSWGALNAIYLAIPALALAYLLHFLYHHPAKSGKVLSISTWCLFTLVTGWLEPALPTYFLLHAGAIWLVRSLFSYSSLIPAFADGFLTLFSVFAFSWAFTRTGSVFLSTWCFFLLQSLWTVIPNGFSLAGNATTPGHEQVFDRARHQADAALRQLFNR